MTSEQDSNETFLPAERRRGRGAVSNASGRFEVEKRAATDDGWDLEEDLPPIMTVVATDRSRTIIARNTSPDIPFDRSVNPYRGCEHGCIYCFARPSHAYLGLSPGLDFETRLTVKPEAARLLSETLSRKSYRPAPIAIGTNTDPYQPIERRYGVMRQVLETLLAHRHPVTIVTKGALILRDVDVLGELAQLELVRVGISVTTLDRSLSRRMEPRASTPAKRLDAIRGLAAAGVSTGVMVAPVIPGLTDHECEAILAAAAAAGADWANWILLRLPLEVSPLFQEWLAESEPLRASRVMKLVRDARGGRDYDAEWGKRMRGDGPIAALIERRFEAARKRLGLAAKPEGGLRVDLFRREIGRDGQLSLDF